MRKVLIIITALLLTLGSYGQSKYYVAPSTATPAGNDSNAGTIDAPWLTWGKAFEEADTPDDTVFFRGGTYLPGVSYYYDLEQDGSPGHHIVFINYQDEVPILDGRNLIAQYGHNNYAILAANSDYITFKGLTIQNVFSKDSLLAHGIYFQNCSHITLERMTFHDIAGRGVYYWNDYAPATPDTLIVLNCDFYNLCDTVSADKGNAADGIWAVGYEGDYHYYEGVRAWNYTDQSIDDYGSQRRVLKDIWSMSSMKYYAICDNDIEGGGPKTSAALHQPDADDHLTKVSNCISLFCKGTGLTLNLYVNYIDRFPANALVYNNTFYSNGVGITDMGYQNNTRTSIYRNNITAYSNYVESGHPTLNPLYEVAIYYPSVYDEQHNTWDATQIVGNESWPGWVYTDTVTVTTDDFVVSDSTELVAIFTASRQADGSLPETWPLTLAATSDLIDMGISDIYFTDTLNLTQSGSAPDIGAVEYSISEDTSPYVSSIEPNITTVRRSYVGGNVTNDGGGTVSARGICWGTSEDPDTGDNVISSGTGTGSYSITITGLTTNTTYHFRAYATNEFGTGYGEDVEFTTPTQSIAVSGTKIMLVNGHLGIVGKVTETPAANTQIIADHTVVDLYDDIPQQWIDSVKTKWISYPGESHALGLLMGFDSLEARDATFQALTRDYVAGGNPDVYSDQYVRVSTAMWGDYISATGWSYLHEEGDWWTNASAIARVKASLTYTNTNGPELFAMGFGWCWDATRGDSSATTDPVTGNRWYGQSFLSPSNPSGILPWGIDDADNTITGNSVNMDTYIAATQSFIDYCADSIPTTIFFTTGPVDTNWDDGISDEALYQGYLKWEHLRNYVKEDETRVLFDAADILCYDDGDINPNTVTWSGNTFPGITDINGTVQYTHMSYVALVRLSKAMWWMLARIAGWDGTIE